MQWHLDIFGQAYHEHASKTYSASDIAAITHLLLVSQRSVKYYESFRLWFTEHTVSDKVL